MAHTAILLGAGASKAEGAALQGELFRDYFSSELFTHSGTLMDSELASFFLEMFQINVRLGDFSKITFPTFEEVLGLTDLATMRKESFRHFTHDSRLRFIAQYLVFLVATVLDINLKARLAAANDRVLSTFHQILVRALHDNDELQNVVFVSTNYDILIDNALIERAQLDYGVDFRNFPRPPANANDSVKLFKPHGSLNWLFCQTCNELKITPQEKAVATRLVSISNIAPESCDQCQSTYSPLIVPPTFYKDLNNVFLSSIWNRTDVALRTVSHIIFCGYSFPDADIHIKYLLKRAQTNRQESPLRITVINQHPNKQPEEELQEKYRYKRFLGEHVEYSDTSFEQFANDPLAVLRARTPTLG